MYFSDNNFNQCKVIMKLNLSTKKYNFLLDCVCQIKIISVIL